MFAPLMITEDYFRYEKCILHTAIRVTYTDCFCNMSNGGSNLFGWEFLQFSLYVGKLLYMQRLFLSCLLV